MPEVFLEIGEKPCIPARYSENWNSVLLWHCYVLAPANTDAPFPPRLLSSPSKSIISSYQHDCKSLICFIACLHRHIHYVLNRSHSSGLMKSIKERLNLAPVQIQPDCQLEGIEAAKTVDHHHNYYIEH